jgi:hemerythrin
MQLVRWLDIYELGVPVIDTQHKNLIFLLNDTYRAFFNNNKTKENFIEEVLDNFINFYSVHFATEEKFMELIDYPFLYHHRDLHSEILSTLYMYKEEYDETKEISIDSFLTLVNQWIFEHLTSEDTKIREYIQYLDKDLLEKYNRELEEK